MRTALGLALTLGLLLAVIAAIRVTPATTTPSDAAGVQASPSARAVLYVPGSIWFSEPTAAPGFRMYLDRIALSPGATLGGDSSQSGAVIFVESGSVAFVVHSGVVFLGGPEGRGGPEGSGPATATPPGPPPQWPDPLPIGVEVHLGPGDTIFHDADAHYSYANAGEDDALLWRSELDYPRAMGCGNARC